MAGNKKEKELNKRIQKAQEWGTPQPLPPGLLPALLGDQLSRDFFSRMGDPQDWKFPKCDSSQNYYWLRLDRLPVTPGKSGDYDLLERWESVLSAAHTMNGCTALALIRRKGRTNIYLGACQEGMSGEEPMRKLSRAARVHMPGMGLSSVDTSAHEGPVEIAVNTMPHTGVVTGLPSSRRMESDTRVNLLQTLDKLAYGVRDENGLDQNYALLVLAEPVNDSQIIGLTQTLLELKSEIHRYVALHKSGNWGEGSGSSMGISVGLEILEMLCSTAGAIAGNAVVPGLGTFMGSAAGKELGKMITGVIGGSGAFYSRSKNTSDGGSVSYDERDEIAAYCEQLIEKNIKRLQAGRSLGFWNTGIYVMGDNQDAVEAVLGMLRSIYSGRETYMEPIRAFYTGTNQGIRDYMENLRLLPLPVSDQQRQAIQERFGAESGWHVFGPLYESFSTPMTTEELSLATNLPHSDVPGLRFVQNAVKMVANPPKLPKDCRKIDLGSVMDMGGETGETYSLNLDTLTRHVLAVGLTGVGKSTTTYGIVDGVADYGVPWLVIEPVKTDYVEWAMERNRHCRPEDRIAIYMPGYERFYGEPLETLRLNPFQPCAPKGVPLNIQGHLDALASLLTASISMGEVLPMLMKEALQELLNSSLGVDPKTGRFIASSNEADPKLIKSYPRLSQLLPIFNQMMERRQYSAENYQNFTAAMETRVKSLLAGWKEDFFEAPKSTTGEELFGRKVIINLIGIEADEDKALFMSLILRALSEYRAASYYYKPEYRAAMQNGDHLMHLTVVEEAHRLISVPTATYTGEGNPQKVTAAMFSNMLREVRKWGEGLMVVDQQPADLIPDAIKNTSLKIIHRMPAEDDRRAAGACMGLNQEQIDLIGALSIGQALLYSEHDDAASWVKIRKRSK